MKKFYLTMLLSLLFCSVSWADGYSQSKTFGATGNPNNLLSNIVSSNYSFTQGAVTITTSNAKYDDPSKSVKVSTGSSLKVSVSSNCVITYLKVYAKAGSGSSKISLTETNDTISFTDNNNYYDQEWTNLASKNLQSVTLSAVDNNVYIQSVTVSYNYKPATVTAPKTWDFTESGDWTTAVSELSADNLWNKTYDNTTFKEARPYSDQTSTYYYDLDMISGLGFTATKDIYPCLDHANHQLWLGNEATLTLPSLEASQRYRITTTDNSAALTTVDGTSITSGKLYTVSTAGNVVLTATGNVWIKKIEILKSASETEASWTYSSKDDADYNCKSYTATIDNTDGGIITAGKVFSGLPGLDFSFGTTGDANWSVGKYYKNGIERSPNIFVQGPATPTLDGDGMVPTSGAFLTLKPVVNGKVTIHFFGWNDNYRWITQNEKGAKLTTLDKNGFNYDRTVTYTVYGGQTYFFYCSVSNNYLLGVNSITFEPSFYLQYAKTQQINDVEYKALTLGEKYDMPFITTTAIPSDRGTISKYDESIGKDIYVLDGGGSFSMIKSTAGNVGAKCVIKNSQFGDVTLSYHYTGINDNKNVWMAYEGFTPKVGDQVTSENGGVTLTFGGWKYGTWTTAANKKRTDKWSAGAGDDAGRDDDNVLTRIIDGFAYETSGNENGYSETKGIFEVGKTHTIPCRGAYAMFEPTKSGSLSIYILQNGSINTFKNEDNVSKPNDDGWTGHAGDFAGNLALRTFYIVDENGKPVSTTPEINNVLRWNQAELDQLANGKKITYYINKVDGTREYMNKEAFDNIFTELNTTRKNGEDISVEVHQLDDGGYAVVQKSYVKYTFDVKPGKTYFIFSNSSKLGICGFKFKADETQATATKELANSGDYTAETDKAYASVTLKGRTFTQNQWTTLCLPFSVSASQMKKTFGDGVQLVEMDHVTTTNNETYDGTTYFYKTILMKNHVYNQMLVAGVPYLIKPDKTVTGATFENVYFPSTAVDAGTVSVADNYTWRGTYGNVNTLGNGDYYVSGKTGQFKYYTTEGHNSNNFRAYLDFNSSTGAKPVVFEAMSVGGEETTTGIETIKAEELDPTEFNTGAVYNLNGQMVSDNSKDLNNLPAGIYIVNGKKYVVK